MVLLCSCSSTSFSTVTGFIYFLHISLKCIVQAHCKVLLINVSVKRINVNESMFTCKSGLPYQEKRLWCYIMSQLHHNVLMFKLVLFKSYLVFIFTIISILDICELGSNSHNTAVLPSAPSCLSFLCNIAVHLTSCDPMIQRDRLKKVY